MFRGLIIENGGDIPIDPFFSLVGRAALLADLENKLAKGVKLIEDHCSETRAALESTETEKRRVIFDERLEALIHKVRDHTESMLRSMIDRSQLTEKQANQEDELFSKAVTSAVKMAREPFEAIGKEFGLSPSDSHLDPLRAAKRGK